MLTDGKGTIEEQERTKEFAKAVFASRAKAEAEQAARESELRSFDDGAGIVWSYVVFDGAEVIIRGCASEKRTIAVPETIEGLPVRVIESDSFSLETLEEVSIPECVVALRTYAFRGCTNLRKVVMACMATKYDSTWFYGCNNIEALYLPHGIVEVKPNVFDLPKLRILHLGKSLERIEPGMFAKSKLEEFSISPKNENFSTDGIGVYSKDGLTFIALARPVASYVVADGVVEVAKKAASNFEDVKKIVLPDTVEKLDDYALSRSGIEEFIAPSRLKTIGNQALCNCKDLKRIVLNEGVETIGDEAFCGTGIKELRVPKTVKVLGNKVVARTSLVLSGPDATFVIDKDCPTLRLDDQGCLYRVDEDEVRLVRILEPNIERVRIAEGTTIIQANAFMKHATLNAVKLPEGLKVIEKDAFSGCRSLEWVSMASTVERIEKDAFIDTALVEFEIPPALEYLGETALITAGAHHDEGASSLRLITVAEGQKKFYKVGGLLCERLEDGTSKAVVYDQSDPILVIPDEVSIVAPYALNGTMGIKQLTLSDNIKSISVRGLGFGCHIPDVYMKTENKPIEGHTLFHFDFPNTLRGIRQLGNAFGVMKGFNVEAVYFCYDLTITNSSSFDLGEKCVDELHDQIKLIQKRLDDPIFLSPVTKDTIDKMFAQNMDEICYVCSKNNDVEAIEKIGEQGYFTEKTLAMALEGVHKAEYLPAIEQVEEVAKELGFDPEELTANLEAERQAQIAAEEAKAKAKADARSRGPKKQYVYKHASDDPTLKRAIFGQ